MKSKKTIGGSIGLLVGVTIAILALVRGTLQVFLLAGVFAVWGLWLLWMRVLPLRCTVQSHGEKETITSLDRQLAQTLLHHVNYRVSACLKSDYPEARWEWMMSDPAAFVAQGGTGRIRVYGVADYNFADVTVDQAGKLSCSLIRLTPVQKAAEKPAPLNQQEFDPKIWYDANARQILKHLVADLDSRGHSSLVLKEDGSICVCPNRDEAEVPQGTLTDFPAKGLWGKLAEVLEQEGLAATVQDACIAVTW